MDALIFVFVDFYPTFCYYSMQRRGAWLDKRSVMPKKSTTEEWVAKANAIHNGKYDYSKVEYKGADKKVIIICPVHGEFEQVAHNHSNGHGCPKCGGKMKLTSEEQVDLITKKNHNVKVLEDIVDDKTPVLCLCKVCNHKWHIRPYDLKNGKSCPKCSGNARKTTEEFIQEAKAKHGGKYDYSKTKYVNAHKEVVIICPEHGEFLQTPSKHLHLGYGCPKCANHGFLRHDQGNLYIMVDDLEAPTMMKIGVSVYTEKRKNEVLKSAKKAGACIPNLYVIKTWEGKTKHMHFLEKAMHQALSKYKINFPMKFSGYKEFFYYRPEVFELVEEYLKKTNVED